MSNRYPGGFITAAEPDVSVSSADGVWTLTQQAEYLSNNQWPPAANQITRSLRFNSADSAYLNRTPAAGNRKTWTWSGWVKRAGLSNDQILFEVFNGNNNNQTFNISLFSSNAISIGAYSVFWLQTTPVYRDVSAWYHIVVAVNTTTATADNRIRVYVNGVEVTAFGTRNNPSQNDDLAINQAAAHYIGSRNGSSIFTNGYLTEVNFVDGQALTPSSFGQTNSTTGVWEPIRYAGSYGTNGFYLNFSDNSGTTATTLGKDYSGNGNNWTPNNFSVTAGVGNDSLVDVPTPYGTDTGAGGEVRGNYATWNVLEAIQLGNSPASNGNLQAGEADNSNKSIRATIFPTTGKWYAEFVVSNGTNGTYPNGFPRIGVSRQDAYQNNTDNSGVISIGPSGELFVDSGTNTWNAGGLPSYVQGDIIMVAFDSDSRKVWFGKNGSWYNFASSGANPATGTNPVGTLSGTTPITFQVRPQWCKIDGNFGQRPFAYTAPSGFKALCTQNLPTPTVVQGDDYFNTVIWTGNGASSRSITGVGFQPDFNWTKQRSGTVWHELIDAVRGTGKTLYSNATNAEATNDSAGYISTFNSDGFTAIQGSADISGYNTNGATYVAWNWNAGGSTVTNTAGTISAQVRANQTAGFSVVTFTSASGTSNFTVGHGLGATPSMVIVKSRSTGPWYVYHASLATNNYLRLNTTNATTSDTDQWGAGMTSTVIGLRAGYSTVPSTDTVAYCFAPVAGYSAFGSYTGNGSADGPFVYTGFRPAWILFKQSSASGNDWFIYDAVRNTYNVATARLEPNVSTAELTNFNTLDMLSNGWKVRDSNSAWNDSGSTYIYAAFSQNPFKYSLAR
jgi:hypothetical protein